MSNSYYDITINKLPPYLILMAVCFLGMGCASQSTLYMGKDLAANCSDGESANSDYCLGYLRGVDNTVSAFFEEGGVDEFSDLYCIDQDLSYSAQRQVVLSWLSAHPESRQDSAWSVIHRSLSEAYPCSEVTLEDLEKDLATSQPR